MHLLNMSSLNFDKIENSATKPKVKKSLSELKNDKQEIENNDLKNASEMATQLHDLRVNKFDTLFSLVKTWLIFVIIVLVFSAIAGSQPLIIRSWSVVFKLSDAVLITFITTTTLTVLGLFVIAAKWLFITPTSKTNIK
jgi:hypothetical protein